MRPLSLLPSIAIFCLGACATDANLLRDDFLAREQGGTSWYWQNGVCIRVATDGADDQVNRVPPSECHVE